MFRSILTFLTRLYVQSKVTVKVTSHSARFKAANVDEGAT